MAEERNYYTDLVTRVEQTCDNFNSLPAGSKERLTEAQIYDTLLKNVIKEEELANQYEKSTKELKIKEDEAKWNKIWGGIKVGLTAVQVGVSGWFGWNYLKANMQFGNMVGKDGKGWFDEIKRIKL